MIALTAANSETSCEMRNITGPACDNYLAGRQASIQLHKDQAKLGTFSAYEECPGICEHNFVYEKLDFVYDRISHYLPQLWANENINPKLW